MFCYNCGAKVKEGNKFCDQCGSKVIEPIIKSNFESSITPVNNDIIKKIDETINANVYAEFKDDKQLVNNVENAIKQPAIEQPVIEQPTLEQPTQQSYNNQEENIIINNASDNDSYVQANMNISSNQANTEHSIYSSTQQNTTNDVLQNNQQNTNNVLQNNQQTVNDVYYANNQTAMNNPYNYLYNNNNNNNALKNNNKTSGNALGRALCIIFGILTLGLSTLYLLHDYYENMSKEGIIGYIGWAVVIIIIVALAFIYMFTKNKLISILYALSIIAMIIVEVIVELIDYLDYFKVIMKEFDYGTIYSIIGYISLGLFLILCIFAIIKIMFINNKANVIFNIIGFATFVFVLAFCILSIFLLKNDAYNIFDIYFFLNEGINLPMMSILGLLSLTITCSLDGKARTIKK